MKPILRPIMIVDSVKRPNKHMTPQQEKEFHHWCNEVHAPDLLKGTGMTSVTRYRDRDGNGYITVQEFESEEVLEKYLVSERRKELTKETQTHYPAGPEDFFDRKVRIFIPIFTTACK